MKYKQITISTTHSFSDTVSVALCDAGSEGASIYDAQEFLATLSEFSWDYVDEDFLADAPPAVLVSGYFDENFDENIITRALDALNKDDADTGSLEMSVTVIDSADWENVWLKFYKPMLIGRTAVIPSWLKNPYENALPVFINPGMAFGTGSHETTSMCIELLQDVPLSGAVADVGCGSGILGLCALALGAEHCTFVDLDPNAVKATRENCALNGLEAKSTVIEGSLLSGKNSYGLILANLTADILLCLYPLLKDNLNAGGTVIISGIIATRLEEVESVYLRDFRTVELMSRNDWRALRLEKL